MICPSGDAVSEAKFIDESALHSTIASGAHASHANCVSSQTDNAARATSSEMKKLKGAELDAAKALVEAHAAVPANMQHAVNCWLKLSPEQQADAYEMHGLGCTSLFWPLRGKQGPRDVIAALVQMKPAKLQRPAGYSRASQRAGLLGVPSRNTH